MKLENIADVNKNISLSLEGDMLNIKITDNSTEYAVLLKYDDGKETVADIIKTDEKNVKIITDNLTQVQIADIYTDSIVFDHVFTVGSEEYKNAPVNNDEIYLTEEHDKNKEMKKSTADPPVLVTHNKRHEINEFKAQKEQFKGLEEFDNFDCRLPEHSMYVFDEDILRSDGIKIMFNGQQVPAWFPYLNYHDTMTEGATLPQKIIGKMTINSVQYITYGVLCHIKDGRQPFFGATGFVYLVPSYGEYAYWIMYLDEITGKICYPYDEEYMSCEDESENVY
ncbi:MAG: hypothetical protein E7218_08635 [Anaerofustis stercorihominis]|nr:hypothetical protein [Anaerofustis stercorihominis]